MTIHYLNLRFYKMLDCRKFNSHKVFGIIILLVSFSACSVSKFSNKQKGEKTTIKIMEDENFVATSESAQPLARGENSRGIITASMLIKGVSLGAEALKKFIDNEKKKYTAEYTDGLSGLYFYSHLSEKNAWDPEGIQLKEFTFIRTFTNKKGKIDTALTITFMLDTAKTYEIYNNSVFRLKIKDFGLKYAKAKIPTKHWYMPWTYFQKNLNDKLDMDIEVNFTTTYNTEQGLIYQNFSLGKFYFFVRNAPLDKKDSNYQKYYDSLANTSLDGSCFIVPRSFGHYFNGSEYKPSYSQGNYSISIAITESGKDKFIDKLIMDNSSIAVDAINQQIKKMK